MDNSHLKLQAENKKLQEIITELEQQRLTIDQVFTLTNLHDAERDGDEALEVYVKSKIDALLLEETLYHRGDYVCLADKVKALEDEIECRVSEHDCENKDNNGEIKDQKDIINNQDDELKELRWETLDKDKQISTLTAKLNKLENYKKLKGEILRQVEKLSTEIETFNANESDETEVIANLESEIERLQDNQNDAHRLEIEELKKTPEDYIVLEKEIVKLKEKIVGYDALLRCEGNVTIEKVLNIKKEIKELKKEIKELKDKSVWLEIYYKEAHKLKEENKDLSQGVAGLLEKNIGNDKEIEKLKEENNQLQQFHEWDKIGTIKYNEELRKNEKLQKTNEKLFEEGMKEQERVKELTKQVEVMIVLQKEAHELQKENSKLIKQVKFNQDAKGWEKY